MQIIGVNEQSKNFRAFRPEPNYGYSKQADKVFRGQAIEGEKRNGVAKNTVTMQFKSIPETFPLARVLVASVVAQLDMTISD